MRINDTLRWRLMKIIAFILTIALCPIAVRGNDPIVRWLEASRAANDILNTPIPRLAELAKKEQATAPSTGQEAMFKLCVFLRAGMSKEATQTLHELKRLSTTIDGLDAIQYYAADRLQDWDLLKIIFDLFPDSVSAHVEPLLEHLAVKGWTVDQIDQWLKSKPKDSNSQWLGHRLRFNLKHGRVEVLERELSDRVRRNPGDISGAIEFLIFLRDTHYLTSRRFDVSWFPETVKTALATELLSLAEQLKGLNPTGALAFARRAMSTPLTPSELEQMRMPFWPEISTSQLQASFAVRTREQISHLLLQLGRASEAQSLMEEAVKLREKNGLVKDLLLAGLVQAQSGHRVIEERILSSEDESTNDPHYWYGRAEYYRGRKESAQEEHAIRMGLSLTAAALTRNQVTETMASSRRHLLSIYAHFLNEHRRDEEAVDLLRKEIAEWPANSPSVEIAARILTSEFEDHISPSDNILWSWLDKRVNWSGAEKDLLEEMLQKAKKRDLEQCLRRAERLANGNDPSRSRVLGVLESQLGFWERSIPFLELAVSKADDEHSKSEIVWSLFEAYLNTGRWKRAQTLDFSFDTSPDWPTRVLSGLAVSAAKAGDHKDAIRFWARVTSLDVTVTYALDQLIESGLRDELFSHYSDLRKTIPSSVIPGRVLEKLKRGSEPSSSAHRASN